MDLDDVRDEWDAEAETFDSEPDHGMLDSATRTAWWRTLQPLLPNAPARVADLGCGTGSVSILLAEHGYDVTGVDLSPRMVERARDKSQAAGLHVQFGVGNAAQPTLEGGIFDVVFARHVVWALPDPAAALHRWVSLLVPGGRFVLVEGRWSAGAGLGADELRALVEPLVSHVEVLPLTDKDLWGREIDDERYVLIGLLCGGAG